MSSRIFLLTPPLVTNKLDLKKSAVNNGLFYIASWLLNRGHEVELLHTEFEGWNTVREETSSTVEYGLSDMEIIRCISVFSPDVIGLTLLATVSYGGFLKIARLIKRHFPKTLLVVGGAHATALPEKTLRESGADFLVMGEGEVVMEEIVNNLGNKEALRNLPSVAYLDEAQVFRSNLRRVLITDLDQVGDLRLELLESVPFTTDPTYGGSAHGKRYLDVFFSRGCPRNCGFCFTPQMWLRQCRTHSLPWVERQVSQMVSAGYKHLLIQDDNFSRMGRWADGVMDIFSQAEVTWENNGGLEMEDLTPDKIRKMASKGATTLFIPLNLRAENTNKIPSVLKDHYVAVLRAAKECDICTYTSHIMGFPEQTKEGMHRQTEFARFLRKQGLSDFHVVYCYSVLPGTQQWHQYMEPTEHGDFQLRAGTVYFDWERWPQYSINSPQVASSNCTLEEIEKIFYESIVHINGEEKAKSWFEGHEWPK